MPRAVEVLLVGGADRPLPGLDPVRRALPEVVLRDRPQVVVVDGFAERLVWRLADAGLRVVVLIEPVELVRALHTGARGFACRDGADAVPAVRAVAAGGTYLAAGLVDRLRGLPPLGGLTVREREVLRLVAQGRSNVEIAREIHVSAATVKTHMSHILTKLDLPNRMHAALLAQRVGLRC
ncbi:MULTISPECIES: helix-turn-helix transcriptional regulator [unclassified Saccharothrix]|uniref:helix-turn-helix transcriptional regulator n=1 Tax=unclassified Saccharothrix TaxID=2593673 RepID=UPI00307D0A2B